MNYFIFLDPDGSQEMGLLVIIKANTGVVYAHQCAGLSTMHREMEGFVVPVGGPIAAWKLIQFFKQFRGNPPQGAMWKKADLQELEVLVGEIPLWKTNRYAEGEDQRVFLQLDLDRVGDLTEAWIPVETIYGPGVLVFENSD